MSRWRAVARVRAAHRDYDRGAVRDEEWLLIEWPEGAQEPTKYYLSTLPKRTPLKTLGASLRTNLFGFAIARLDYSIPQDRPAVKGLWTFSLGPTF